MKSHLLSFTLILTCVVAFVNHSAFAAGAQVLVEAEGFENPGGWVVDQQFMDQMALVENTRDVVAGA